VSTFAKVTGTAQQIIYIMLDLLTSIFGCNNFGTTFSAKDATPAETESEQVINYFATGERRGMTRARRQSVNVRHRLT